MAILAFFIIRKQIFRCIQDRNLREASNYLRTHYIYNKNDKNPVPVNIPLAE